MSSGTTLRPSPNEVVQLHQDEAQRRRKLRILQVREQEKMVAIRIRRAMQEKHEEEIENLANALKKKWRKDQQETLKKTEEKYMSNLKDVGSAHEDAKENAPNQALVDAITDDKRKLAEERGRHALEHQRTAKKMREEESIEKRRKRHVALIKEKLRAKHIANLPSPVPNPADTFLNSTDADNTKAGSAGSIPHQPARYTTIQISDHESTMPTMVSLGLPLNAVVERATAAEAATDAREEARKEGERISMLQEERNMAVQECMEKAKVRHLAALEQARLDRESQDLMNDLKQLKLKDALRRQHHIEYRWDDNTNSKRACQDLFGPPGSKYQESELLSRDLKKSREEEELPSCLESSTDGPSSGSQNTTGWQSVPENVENGEKAGGKALNRLLKQIEAQRQQRRNGTASESPTENADSQPEKFEAEFNVKEDSENAEDSVGEKESSLGKCCRAVDTESTLDDAHSEHVTVPKLAIPVPDLTQTTAAEPEAIPLQKAPEISEENVPDTSSGKHMSTSSLSLLKRSMENMRNDEALLKSVKDFQERLLQQHQSCARIQEQIQRLERKKAAIDSMVDGITKPNGL